MNIYKITLPILCLIPNFRAYAEVAASINTTAIVYGTTAGANAASAAANRPRCPKSGSSCVRMILGYAQMGISLVQMLQTIGSRDSLSPGTDWSNPYLVDQFGPISASDRDYMDPIMAAVRSGNYADYLAAQKKLTDQSKADLELLAKNGYTYDEKTGTITTPTGTQSVADLAALGADGNVAAYEDRLNKALGLDTSGGGGLIVVSDGSKSSSGRSLSSLTSSSVDDFLNNLDNGNIDAKQVAGLSTNTKDGTPIGVSVGNLFRTMQTKYDNLKTQNEFK